MKCVFVCASGLSFYLGGPYTAIFSKDSFDKINIAARNFH